MSYIALDGYGFIKAERILTIGKIDSAPMRRLLASLPRDKVVYLTGGRRRQSVVLLDTGHAVVTALPPAELLARLESPGPDTRVGAGLHPAPPRPGSDRAGEGT